MKDLGNTLVAGLVAGFILSLIFGVIKFYLMLLLVPFFMTYYLLQEAFRSPVGIAIVSVIPMLLSILLYRKNKKDATKVKIINSLKTFLILLVVVAFGYFAIAKVSEFIIANGMFGTSSMFFVWVLRIIIAAVMIAALRFLFRILN